MLPRTFLSVFVLALSQICAAAAPKVVVSIKPVHSLVAAVMKGAGEPVLLIDGHTSPHTYALKPSDAAALQNADVIVRIGPDMEAFLNGPLKALGNGAAVVDLSETPGLVTLGFRPAGMFTQIDGTQSEQHEHHDHDEEETGQDHQDHEHIRTTFDMHFWLDPDNAGQMVRYITDALIEADPANVGLYQANSIEMLNKLNLMSDDVETLLEPTHEQRFIVFHDAYRYFENRFGLHAAGSIALNPQSPPGAETLSELKAAVASGHVVCAFIEPQFSSKLIEAISEGTQLRIGTLDPVGIDIEAGPDHYEKMIRAMAKSFRDCLGG